MVGNEEFSNKGTHKIDGYDGVAEDVGSGLGKQTAKFVLMGFAGGEHGGSDGDDSRRGREWWLIEQPGENEGV